MFCFCSLVASPPVHSFQDSTNFGPKKIMTLLCQKNSYLRDFKDAAVKSVQKGKIALNGSSKLTDGFDVVLEDTIFFPEGGGQPSDVGTLDSHFVSSVRRDGEQAVLFIADECAKKDDGGDVPPPFKVGDKPVQKIDWTKRFDHMQQHSGQHLITAIALKLFNLETTSWYLGVDSSFIEMDAKEISEETMEVIEEKVNEKIRERVDVLVTYREPDNLADVRFRMDVPEAQRGGPVRVVEITDVDKNTCCGTHVVNLGDLQAIKLLGTAKGNKGKTQLHFVAGGRVLKYLGLTVKREKSLTALLKCTPENLEPMVDKTQKTVKRLHKNCVQCLRDLGKLEAERLLQTPEDALPTFITLHRKEGEFDFISSFISSIGTKLLQAGRLFLISIADDSLTAKSPGQIMLAGEEEYVKKAADIAINQFAAKGSVQQAKFRGRILDVSKLPKLEEAIRSTFLKDVPNYKE